MTWPEVNIGHHESAKLYSTPCWIGPQKEENGERRLCDLSGQGPLVQVWRWPSRDFQILVQVWRPRSGEQQAIAETGLSLKVTNNCPEMESIYDFLGPLGKNRYGIFWYYKTWHEDSFLTHIIDLPHIRFALPRPGQITQLDESWKVVEQLSPYVSRIGLQKIYTSQHVQKWLNLICGVLVRLPAWLPWAEFVALCRGLS